VCFISHSSSNGGAEKAFPKLLQELEIKGIKTFVLLPSKGPIESDLRNRNLEYKIIPYKLWMDQFPTTIGIIKRSVKNIFLVFPVALQILRWNCSIVYTNTCTVSIGAFSAKLLGIPHIWHFREFGFEDHGFKYDWGQKISFWLTNKLSTICLANSKSVAEKYGKYIPVGKIKVLYEAYKRNYNNENKSIIPRYENVFNCLMVASMQEGKGHMDAILAIKELTDNGINVKLYIAGEGHDFYKEHLTKQVKSLNLEKYVVFLGFINNVQLTMKQSDLLIVCSRNEAYGLVTIEAMESALTIVGTNSGGTKELIIDGFNGLLYKPGDYFELANKILYIINNPEIAKQMGNNGKKWVQEKINPDQYILETVKILNDVINK